MKRLSFFLLFLGILISPFPYVFASSEQAYQDYIYQSDVYRNRYNDFQIAKNEYLKFKSLTSETAAVQKTRDMLSQRSFTLKTYLLLLQEKIGETTQMPQNEQSLYRESIQKENLFLETHSQFVGSVQTLTDAARANKQLEDRYLIMQTSIRQVILGLSLARLRSIADDFFVRIDEAKVLVDRAKTELPVEKHSILDRWLLQIDNKKTLYQQKQDQVTQTITSLKGTSIQDLDKKFTDMQSKIIEAQQEIKEGSSYLTELSTALLYKD